ncbi:MAG: 4-(cytidine 5'-diphospho)-2-C-methyl-D-erythritol kinase [Pseudomonadota bacterium]
MTTLPMRVWSRAKINLTLKVVGRLPNGYHALESLVAFASAGDVLVPICEVFDTSGSQSTEQFPTPVSHWTGHAFSPSRSTPEAAISDNLIDQARSLLSERHPSLVLPVVHLYKALPVASGVGGGSANAAAYLRLVRAANPVSEQQIDWAGLALELGADVPVCLAQTPCLMTGIGDHLVPVTMPKAYEALLVHPRCPVPKTKTGDVFRALNASAVSEADARALRDRAEALAVDLPFDDLILHGQNDLTEPAIAVMPEIANVFDALHASGRARVVRLSGAGPTVFALFDDRRAAREVSQRLRADHSSWWVRRCAIGPATRPDG